MVQPLLLQWLAFPQEQVLQFAFQGQQEQRLPVGTFVPQVLVLRVWLLPLVLSLPPAEAQKGVATWPGLVPGQ